MMPSYRQHKKKKKKKFFIKGFIKSQFVEFN